MMSRIRLLFCFCLLTTSCAKSREETPAVEKQAPSTEQSALLKEAKTLTEAAYDLKLEGRNREALERFEKAFALLNRAAGPESGDVASNLDDQATVHLRTGQYQRARALYRQALAIEKRRAPEGSRLASGVERRLATLDALEHHEHVCREPLTPKSEGTEASSGPPLPYFPEKQALYTAYARMADELKPCLEKSHSSKPIPVWTVLLGTGRIVLARTEGPLAGTESAKCLETTLIKVSPKYADDMPHFSACYRNFKYPFLIVL